MQIPQENQCYWVHPVERGLDHDIGDPADDVLDHRDKEADPNDTFAPSDYAGLTLTFPFLGNFFLCVIFFMFRCANVLHHPSERKLVFKQKFSNSTCICFQGHCISI